MSVKNYKFKSTKSLRIYNKAYFVKSKEDDTPWVEADWYYTDSVNVLKAHYSTSEGVPYADVRVKRHPWRDIVIFEGKNIRRDYIVFNIELENVKNDRAEMIKKFMEQYDGKDFFYIQDGYVGNEMCFWSLLSQGYTTDLELAQRYSFNEIISFIKSGMKPTTIWHEEILKHTTRCIKKENIPFAGFKIN